MDQTRKQLEEQPKPGTGIARDMKRLHGDASATAAELREFVATLKGRSPQEVLGAIGQSSLFHGIVQASVGTLVVLVAFTVVPYFWYGPADAKAETTETASESEPVAAASTTAATDPAAVETAEAGTSETPATDAARAAQAMGIDETRPADPKVNPLDKNLDTLLDGLE